MKLDIVYPFQHSEWYDYELMYSIRSIVKHTEHGEIYVIGDNPKFNKVNNLPFIQNSHREKNIWDKVYHACNNVAERFLFINDDHFFLKDVDISNYPYYHDGKIEKKGWLREVNRNPYFTTVSRTLSLLRHLNLPTYYYDIHTPMIIETSKFKKCYEYFYDHISSGSSLLLKSTYCNYLGVEGEFMPDLKLKQRYNKGQIRDMIKGREVFSVGDRAVSGALKEVLDELYTIKYSIFE